VGIRAVSPVNCSNIYFYTNNFNFKTNGNGINTNYGIFVSGVFLDTNLDNFTNNAFVTLSPAFFCYATNYPVSFPYTNNNPNTWANIQVATNIANLNTN
jgi:hypothetical protein